MNHLIKLSFLRVVSGDVPQLVLVVADILVSGIGLDEQLGMEVGWLRDVHL